MYKSINFCWRDVRKCFDGQQLQPLISEFWQWRFPCRWLIEKKKKKCMANLNMHFGRESIIELRNLPVFTECLKSVLICPLLSVGNVSVLFGGYPCQNAIIKYTCHAVYHWWFHLLRMLVDWLSCLPTWSQFSEQANRWGLLTFLYVCSVFQWLNVAASILGRNAAILAPISLSMQFYFSLLLLMTHS